MTNPPPEKLLPKAAIAELLGVTPRTVWKWYRRGKLAGVQFGGKGGPIRFYWSAVAKAVLPKGRP